MWKLLVTLTALVGLASFSAAEADNLAYTTSSTVLRRDPSTKAHVVANVPKDAELAVGHCTDGWCFAHFGEKSGYVAVSQLDFADTGGTVVERTYVEPTYVYPGYYPGPYVVGPAFYCCGGYGHWHGGPGYWRR